jgi:hypothetical protein
MTINTNTKNNRMEIVFSAKPSDEVRQAIQEQAHFVYRNIGGKLMWLCTAKYLVKEDYNAFIKEYCKDFKKVILKDGKEVKIAKAKTEEKKTESKKTTAKAKTTAKKTASKDDRIAELERQLAELKAEVEAMNRPQLTATMKKTGKKHNKPEAVLMVNGRVVR